MKRARHNRVRCGILTRISLAALLAIVCVVSGTLNARPRHTAKRYDSPDKRYMAIVLTENPDSMGLESSVELRYMDGRFIGRRSYFTKSHGGGLGVVKAHWSTDGKFFIFSMVGSRGNYPGKFPTFYYSSIDNRIHALDPSVGMWITDPEFSLGFDDIVIVTVHDTLPGGAVADTISRTVHLGGLKK